MRMWTFANRNRKEILRDPLSTAFGLGFPIVLLLLLTTIQRNAPVVIFEIRHLAPGIAVLSLSFATLFSASLISKDRYSSLLQRLYTTPMRPIDFILGYTVPMLPLVLAQCVITYGTSVILGLKVTLHIVPAIIGIVPIALLFIALGLFFGSILTDKQVGGICGALLTNLTGWLSGIWFDLSLMGGLFAKIANALPFVHAVELERAVIQGNFSGMLLHLAVVLAYGAVTLTAAVLLFLRQMKGQ